MSFREPVGTLLSQRKAPLNAKDSKSGREKDSKDVKPKDVKDNKASRMPGVSFPQAFLTSVCLFLKASKEAKPAKDTAKDKASTVKISSSC